MEFPTIYFDIVGGCNAKCPLCVTARTTFGDKIEHISVTDFSRAINRLISLGLAKPGKSIIKLYSWGEPILHPRLEEIIAVLANYGLQVGISTNASKATNFMTPTTHFAELVFSVPGWSQESQDKIHGFKFERIIANMEATIENIRSNGYAGPITLSYHIYQFNCFAELEAARQWCDRNGVVLQAYLAYINDYEPNKAYLKGALDHETKENISKKLFLHYVADLVKSQQPDWKCPQWDEFLTINHRSEALLCCVLPQNHAAYALGSIFELSRDEILSLKKSNAECDDCLGCGTAYWVHNPRMIALPEARDHQPQTSHNAFARGISTLISKIAKSNTPASPRLRY